MDNKVSSNEARDIVRKMDKTAGVGALTTTAEQTLPKMREGVMRFEVIDRSDEDAFVDMFATRAEAEEYAERIEKLLRDTKPTTNMPQLQNQSTEAVSKQPN